MAFYDLSIRNDGENRHFRCRTGSAVFEESLFCSVPVNAGINAAGYPLDVLTNCPTRTDPRSVSEPFVFNFEIDGETVCRSMTLKDIKKEEKDGVLTAETVFDSAVRPVRITERSVLDGTNVMTRSFRLKNLSSSPAALNRAVLYGGLIESFPLSDRSWSSRLPEGADLYTVTYFGNDGWGHEGELIRKPLHGRMTVDCRFGADRFRHPAVFIRSAVTGTLYFIQTAWSGGCRFELCCDMPSGADEAKLEIAVSLTGYSPLTVLSPGEELTLPEVHICAVHGDTDDAVNAMNEHLRRSVFVVPGAKPSGCLIGAGMGAEHDMSLETTKAFIDQMSDMGAEVFIVDAGWVCPPGKEMQWGRYNGLNVPDPDRYHGKGLSEVRDYCLEKNMKFGLWTEIERVGELSGIREKHPDWFASDLFGHNGGGFLDLTVNEAAEWAENELARILTEYRPDLLRVDWNISIRDAFRFRDLGTGREECLSFRHFERVYKIYSSLKKRFPDVIFENCASGGGRTDIGMMKAFDHTWVSDNQTMPESVLITNGMTCVLPPERVDRLFAGMGCHRRGDLAAHLRNTMLTHMSLNVIVPAGVAPDPGAMEFIRHSTSLYKNFIRPFLPSADVFHHTVTKEDVREKGCAVLEIAPRDKSRSVIAVFTAADRVPGSVTVFPRGIKAGARYKVTLDNTRDTYTEEGSRLLGGGIRVHIGSLLSSELILLEEITPQPGRCPCT